MLFFRPMSAIPVQQADPATASHFLVLLQVLIQAFGDPSLVEKDFQALYPDKDMNDQEFRGAGPTLPELYVADLSGFADEILSKQNGEYYLLNCASDSVNGYLKYFDVKAKGPDALKHAMQFGFYFERYLAKVAERPIIAALARMRMIRVLHALSGQHRQDLRSPPIVMVRKILKVWKNENQEQLLGWYGTYMLFKTWSLG